GHAVSDQGSGYWIGREAVKAALRDHDAQNDSVLLSSLMDALEVKDFDDFIVRINADPQPDYAALFPVAQSLAERGDSTSISVLERAGSALAHLAEIVVGRLFGDGAAIGVATYGGALAASKQLREYFLREIRRCVPQVEHCPKDLDAARGALQSARKRLRI